jgi:hypothetical protein
MGGAAQPSSREAPLTETLVGAGKQNRAAFAAELSVASQIDDGGSFMSWSNLPHRRPGCS